MFILMCVYRTCIVLFSFSPFLVIYLRFNVDGEKSYWTGAINMVYAPFPVAIKKNIWTEKVLTRYLFEICIQLTESK